MSAICWPSCRKSSCCRTSDRLLERSSGLTSSSQKASWGLIQQFHPSTPKAVGGVLRAELSSYHRPAHDLLFMHLYSLYSLYKQGIFDLERIPPSVESLHAVGYRKCARTTLLRPISCCGMLWS